MDKLIKKDCEKLYISKEHYNTLDFLICEHFIKLNMNSLKQKDYDFNTIAKKWIEDYIDNLYKKYCEGWKDKEEE